MQLLDVEIKLFNLKHFFTSTLKKKKMLTLPQEENKTKPTKD